MMWIDTKWPLQKNKYMCLGNTVCLLDSFMSGQKYFFLFEFDSKEPDSIQPEAKRKNLKAEKKNGDYYLGL